MDLSAFLREKVFPYVQAPGQYLGGETNAIIKPNHTGGKFCMIFPDSYSIGMSCHAVQVLYDIMNRQDGWCCERSFAPLSDMEQLIQAYNIPWFSLETKTPLNEFDVLGFTLQHELCYTNVLSMLKLSHISILSSQREQSDPLVIAGGPCVWNPEPLGDIFDAFIIGDGEESLPLVCDKWRQLRQSGVARQEALHQLSAAFTWLYVSSCYKLDENFCPVPLYSDVPATIRPAVVEDLDKFPSPAKPVIPWVEAVQDRVAVEVMRGCPWRCRFCQSCPIKRPLRFRQPENVIKSVLDAVDATGHEEVTLLSLSTGDYPHINDVIAQLDAHLRPCGVSVSVPSLRINQHLTALGEVLRTQKHSGLTLAVEAAQEDMRVIIGKPIKNTDLLEGCRIAFSRGFQRVKMYFMCGFPGERKDDLDGMIELAESVAQLGKQVSGRWPKIVISVSNLVPKPHTPFQWHPMQTREYFKEAARYLRYRRLPSSITIKSHDVECSILEGIMCRADRRAGAAIIEAWKNGAKFDSWTEQFRPDIWEQAFLTVGLDVKSILHKPHQVQDRLPWDFIEIRQGRKHLEDQFNQSVLEINARQEQPSEP